MKGAKKKSNHETKVELSALELMERKHYEGMREHFPEMMLFFCYLGMEGERSAVVLGAERLSVAVENLLKAYLLPSPNKEDKLFKPDGPLGTFSGKTEVAYRIGLIDLPLKRALDLVRHLRNDFAHATLVEKLKQQEHADRVKQLRAMMEKGNKGIMEEFEEHFKKETKATKLACSYLGCVMYLLIELEITRFQIDRPKHRFVATLDKMGDDIN